MYHMKDNKVALGYVVGLDYQNTYLHPHPQLPNPPPAPTPRSSATSAPTKSCNA